ncbi:MAG TPA: putative maltokinase [Gemmataceae bacterium]|nr:putative maltokinase [Gemmataceae bacterium]
MRNEEGLPTVEVSGGRASPFEEDTRHALERAVLPAYLRGQRWFGGKARQIESVRFTDWGELPAGSTWAFLTLLEVYFADGGRDLYCLPLALSSGAAAERIVATLRSRALARLTGHPGGALLHDALADDAVCAALLGAIAEGSEIRLKAGRVRAFTTAAFPALRGRVEDPLPVTRGPESSSNTLVLFGERLLLKVFRRLEAGTNPDFEVGRYLTEATDFDRIPKVAGAIEYHPPQGEHYTLAILQALVANQGDGWRHALDELSRYFERAARGGVGPYLDAAATLGRRTAEMHRALAAGKSDPAFAPEPMTADDVAALAQDILAQGRQALEGTRESLGRLPESVAPAARQFLDEAPAVLRRWAEAPGVRPGAIKIRCHGDYHLGQVLWADDDFVILDFEGEPTRTIAERRAKQSPLKDVAGMLRSFDYAAYAGLFAFTQDRPDHFGRLAPEAERWRQAVSAAFLDAYRATAADLLPADAAQRAALLDAFLLAKALYELVYELNNRPDWARIPLRGILALLEGGRGRG